MDYEQGGADKSTAYRLTREGQTDVWTDRLTLPVFKKHYRQGEQTDGQTNGTPLYDNRHCHK